MKEEKKNRLKGNTIASFLHRKFTVVGLFVGIFSGVSAILIIYNAIGELKAGEMFKGLFSIGFAAVIIVFIVIVDVMLYRMANSVSDKLKIPITQIESAMKQLAEGNLKTQIDYHQEDEFYHVANDTRATIQELQRYVENITDILQELTNKNMTATVDIEYIGDFLPIKESLENITSSFNEMFTNMKKSFENIEAGSDNLARTAQSLASGASNQQKEVKELVTTINQVSENVSVNAKNADNVATISTESLQHFEASNQKMQQLLEAMESIQVQSDEISKIIQVIDSIAQQTNLLSLNASIEAARAGEQGKGFAVVAAEIGKLASECGAAAQTTTELITNSISSVKEGSFVARETADILVGVVKASQESTDLVNKISKACKDQDEALKKVLNSVHNIENVVEMNSSVAEESSALSEELLASVEELMNQINEYKLR